MDSYDNDFLLLILDDDLFWRENDVEAIQSQPSGPNGR